MTAKPVTPAEAKAVWESLEDPSSRKVAAKFKAAGRPITHKTIAKWKAAGWGAKTGAQVVAGAAASVEAINVALPALTGDVTSKLGDALAGAAPVPSVSQPAPQATNGAAQDDRSNAEIAEDALLAAITGATTVWNTITALATMKPPEGDQLDPSTPPVMLMVAPEGMAKLMKASSEAISRAIEDYKQIPLLRAEAAAAVPGTQTVYAPGEDYPLRSSMEAFDAKLKEIREARAK